MKIIRTCSLLFSLIFIIGTMQAQSQSEKEKVLGAYLLEKYLEESGANHKPAYHNDSLWINKDGSVFEQKITENDPLFLQEVEPTIAVNPLNPDNVVVSFVDYPSLESSAYYSLDAGQSWEKSIIPSDSIFMEDHDFDNFGPRGIGDPVMAFDADGRLYFVYLYIDSGLTQEDGLTVAQYICWSDDGGAHFEFDPIRNNRMLATGTWVEELEGAWFDRPWIAVDKSDGPLRGTVYIQSLVFSFDNPILGPGPNFSSMVFYKSPSMQSFDSYGVKLDELIMMDTSFIVTQHANVHVDNNGYLHSSFSGSLSGAVTGDETEQVYHLVSQDGSQSFQDSTAVAKFEYNPAAFVIPIVRENPMPDAVTNPNTGSIHLVHGTKTSTNAMGGVYYTSNDGGLSWSNGVNLSDLLSTSPSNFFFSTIACDEVSGRLSIAYFTQEDDGVWNYYMSSSEDDGISWCGPLKVSGMFTDFDEYSQLFFYGDYWETKMVNDKTYCIWVDGRAGMGPKVYFALVDHRESTSISEVSSVSDKLQIKAISPNPSDGHFNVDFELQNSMTLEFSIFNLEGKKQHLKTQIYSAGSHVEAFDLSTDLPSGTYVLQVNSEVGIVTRKLVKN